jgi:hypothetical protein
MCIKSRPGFIPLEEVEDATISGISGDAVVYCSLLDFGMCSCLLVNGFNFISVLRDGVYLRSSVSVISRKRHAAIALVTYCPINGEFTFWNVPGAVILPLRFHHPQIAAFESSAVKIKARVSRPEFGLNKRTEGVITAIRGAIRGPWRLRSPLGCHLPPVEDSDRCF